MEYNHWCDEIHIPDLLEGTGMSRVTRYRNRDESGILAFLVLAMGKVLTFAMTIAQIPQALAASLVEVAHNKYLFLLLVQILFFLIGMMDSLPALIILIPILTPIAVTLGVEPIHFGILVEANVALAMAHPPAGVCLFAACGIEASA